MIDLSAVKSRKLEKTCVSRLETLRHIELFVAYAQRVSSSTPNHQETSFKAKRGVLLKHHCKDTCHASFYPNLSSLAETFHVEYFPSEMSRP